jgi:hypothetical protein
MQICPSAPVLVLVSVEATETAPASRSTAARVCFGVRCDGLARRHGLESRLHGCGAAFRFGRPQLGIQYMRHSEETDRVFPHSYTFSAGMMHPRDAPGLGVDIDEAFASTYPYVRAYLPVNRTCDFAMHSW